jgi:hypothetical protein
MSWAWAALADNSMSATIQRIGFVIGVLQRKCRASIGVHWTSAMPAIVSFGRRIHIEIWPSSLGVV